MNTVHRTTCNRDCPDACAIDVVVDDAGRATHLRGVADDPITRGFLCERTSRFLERQYDDERLTHPLLRKNGRLERVTWDEALDRAATELARVRSTDGAAAILHYRSGGSLGILKCVADAFFARFGPVTGKRGDICSGAGEAAQARDLGIAESHDLFDLDRSRAIVVWGKNPHTSGVHLLPILRRARERGAVVVSIDPVRTKMTTLASLVIQPRPGRDAALAFGVARCLFEAGVAPADVTTWSNGFERYRAEVASRSVDEWAMAAGVATEDVRALARVFRDHGPAAILVGWGLARRTNGAATVRALDALAAVSGNIGVEGGGVSYYFGRRRAFDTDFGLTLPPPPRELIEPILGQEILAAVDPPIRLAWVTAGNPLSMLPESETVRRAFASLEFSIVVDTHATDTTDVCDLVLPTLTLLEDDDLLGAYGNHFLRASRPALAPPQEAWHETRIFRELARRLDVGNEFDVEPRTWKERAMGRLAAAGVPLERIERGPVRNPFAKTVLYDDHRFATGDGRFDFVGAAALPSFTPTAEWPLSLMAISTPKAQSSQQIRRPGSEAPVVAVHPSSAVGLDDGRDAMLETAIGAMRVRVVIDDRVHPEIALMEKGGMARDGRCSNAIVRARLTDDGEGAAYYDEPCRLTPIR